jgi:hypothetical protein
MLAHGWLHERALPLGEGVWEREQNVREVTIKVAVLFSLCNFTIMYIKMHRKIFNRIIRKQNV